MLIMTRRQPQTRAYIIKWTNKQTELNPAQQLFNLAYKANSIWKENQAKSRKMGPRASSETRIYNHNQVAPIKKPITTSASSRVYPFLMKSAKKNP